MQHRKNGCHNRKEYLPTVLVQDGWKDNESSNGTLSRTAVMKKIPFEMQANCNYTHTTLGRADKGCLGCKWRADDNAAQQAA